jgi:acetolactate synthase-1/2/3 large subunit
VSVEIPIDVQRTVIERPAALDSLELILPGPLVPSEAALDALAAVVRQAKRPILWLGAGAREAGGPARALVEMGFGAVSSWAGRGTIPEDHPRNLGGLNGNGVPAVQEFYARSDLMLVAASRLRGHETSEFSVKLPGNLVQIDIDPAAEGRTYPCRMFVHGDVGLVLEGLARRLAGWAPEAGFAEEFAAMKVKARADFAASMGPYETFPAQLRAALPRDVVWARDITINHSTWGNRLFELYGPRDSVYPIGAAIGAGLPIAIGAAVGAPGRRTVVMTGDGGFFLTLSELWTAVQDKVDITIVVMNDSGYGVIKHIQNSLYGGRNFFADLMGPDMEKLAGLAGMPFWRVDRADAFGATVAEASRGSGPTLVEVDMTAIGVFPPYAPYDKKRS